MSTGLKVFLGMIVAMFLMSGVTGCTIVSMYNRFPSHDEAVKEAWAQVQSSYKRRADLIQNQANVAEKYMSEEQKLVIGNAKARAGNAVLPDNATPEQIKSFQEAQAAMKTAVNVIREVAAVSRGDRLFMNLNKELSNTENMIRARRDRYIKEVKGYNLNVRTFPSSMIASWAGYKEKAQLAFEDENEIKNAPVLFKK